MLDFMMICNDVNVAEHAVKSGVDRIFIDLEKLGKQARQKGRDTVISSHSLEDIVKIRERLPNNEILVRTNPIHDGSKDEIDEIIKRGADILMLPMFTTRHEVEQFIEYVNGQAKICLLVETGQALVRLQQILEFSESLYEVYFGLNDLHISLGLDFMFECLAGGIVELGVQQVCMKNIRTGFGGIGRVGGGAVPAEHILSEHVRLGSSIVILSRTFYSDGNLDAMAPEIHKLREEERKYRSLPNSELERNRDQLKDEIWKFSLKNRIFS